MKPTSDPPPADLIRPSRAARILGCCMATMYRYILQGKLRAWRQDADRYLVSEADVGAMVRRRCRHLRQRQAMPRSDAGAPGPSLPAAVVPEEA